jgi:hypothetical protein
MTQTLVGEAGGSQELEALNLAEVRPLAKSEQVEKLRDVVPSVRVSAQSPECWPPLRT